MLVICVVVYMIFINLALGFVDFYIKNRDFAPSTQNRGGVHEKYTQKHLIHIIHLPSTAPRAVEAFLELRMPTALQTHLVSIIWWSPQCCGTAEWCCRAAKG